MVSVIKPVTREWAYTFLLQPALEGTERICRAWKGIRSPVNPTSLKWHERVISLLAGMVLLIPLVSTVAWIAWKTFGSPEPLSDNYNPELPAAAPHQRIASMGRRASILPPIPPLLAGAPPSQVEQFAYDETGPETEASTHWKVDTFPDRHVVQQYGETFSSRSQYTPDWQITEFRWNNNNRLNVWLRAGNRLEMQLIEGENEVTKWFDLPPQSPWVQQPTIGLKNFILSNETTFRFHGVSPKNPSPFGPKPPFAIPFIATKKGEEEIEGYGRLMKVEVVSEWRWPYNRYTAQLWFDRQTGALRKFTDPFEGTTGLARLLPAPAHP